MNNTNEIIDKIFIEKQNIDREIIEDKLKISGSIGMVKLIKNTKNIFIFYDDHSNINYCKNRDSVFLFEIFENIIDNNSDYIILLEEPFVDNYSNIKFLWNETPHIIKFRNFYKKILKKCSLTKICKVFPTDIRLIICDVSIDELLSNLNNSEYFNNYKVSTLEYFKYILYLFDYIELNESIFVNYDKNIIFIKKIFKLFYDTEYYKKLKEKCDMIYNKFIEPYKNTNIKDFLNIYKIYNYSLFSGYPFVNLNENDFIDQYDKFLNGIMEFYIFILIIALTNKNIIIYAGYYHSNNLTYILEKYYSYKKIYKIGNTENIEKKNENLISNCLYVPKNIFIN